jgi:hypothetical protein
VYIRNEGFFASMEGWNTTWLGMSDMTPYLETSKPHESIVSQSKLISIEEKFQDINRQMLETSYILNLGQLLKMVLELKRYLWRRMKLNKPHNVATIVIEK